MFAVILCYAMLVAYCIAILPNSPIPVEAILQPELSGGLLLVGIPVLLLTNQTQDMSTRLACLTMTAAAIIVGILCMIESWLGWSVGEHIFVWSGQAQSAEFFHHQALTPFVALNLTLISLALFKMQFKTVIMPWLAEFLVAIVIFSAVIALVQKLYLIPETAQLLSALQMPPTASFSFLALGLALVFASPSGLIMEVVLYPEGGGPVARSLLPFVFVLPIIFGQLNIFGHLVGQVETQIGTTIFVLSLIGAMTLVVFFTAKWLNQMDLERRIAENNLKRLTEKLKEARDQALEVSRFKSEFLANMSHEIRTPMNAIIGISNILERAELSRKERDLIGVMRNSCNALLSLINDVLDLSKIEAGRLNLEVIEFDALHTVEDSVALLQAQALAKNLVLNSFVDPEIPATLFGDPMRLRQILVNLLGNAIKFTSEGTVLVSAKLLKQEEDTVTIKFTVKDTGIGIPPDQVKKLFTEFVQLDGSTSRKFGGTGLGLSICRHLVRLMGGDIDVESEQGKGSTFWFNIPFEVSDKPRIQKDWQTIKGLKILIIDDDPITLESLGLYLKSWGLKCDPASSGKEAIKMLNKAAETGAAYEMALVDLVLPDMTGLDVMKEAKENEALYDLRLILITAYDRAGQGEEVVQAGFDAYLTKPFNQSNLFDAIANVMRQSEPERYVEEKVEPVAEKARQAAAARAAKAAPPGRTVLLVEDNEVNQMVASTELEHLGYKVKVAVNGVEAVEAVENDSYSLVLMDCQMPEMDGYEATKQIRKKEALTGGHLPIVAMTAHAMTGDREKCIAAGMDDYLSKPFDVKDLKEILARWIPVQDGEAKDADTESNAGQIEDKEAGRTEDDDDEGEDGDDGLDDLELFDISRLSGRFGRKTTVKVLKVFKDNTADTMQKLDVAIKNKDSDEIASICHYLKSSCGTVYATSLQELVKEMEQDAKKENSDWKKLDKSFALFKRLFSMYETSIDEEQTNDS